MSPFLRLIEAILPTLCQIATRTGSPLNHPTSSEACARDVRRVLARRDKIPIT